MQLAQIAVNCNAAEKALLADVTEAHPDASYVELLRLFKVRCAHCASCLLRVTCEHLLTAAAPYPPLGSTLFVCLFACDWPLQNAPSMARPTPHELLCRSASPLCVHWCAATNPAEPL